MLTADPEVLAYTVNGFCAAVGISRSRAYEELKAGRLRATKCGSRTLIRRQDAEAWLDRLAAKQHEVA